MGQTPASRSVSSSGQPSDIRLKVVALASNTNSFGLRGVTLISSHGQCWEVASPALHVPRLEEIIEVPRWSSIEEVLTRRGFELIRRLQPDPPPAAIAEVWGEEPTPPALPAPEPPDVDWPPQNTIERLYWEQAGRPDWRTWLAMKWPPPEGVAEVIEERSRVTIVIQAEVAPGTALGRLRQDIYKALRGLASPTRTNDGLAIVTSVKIE